MKKVLILIALFTATIITSCEKKTTSGTEIGTVRFTCTSQHPYKLWIDGTYETTLDGNSFIEIDLLEGSHTANVEQASGYVLYPTKRNTTLNVFGGQEIEWVFP